ncbi:sensor histidine kinase [Niameybacter massiliensis]|uniref:sensor histidine kinase n=1 Tax=Niameybacter massiliensis TaxID=1658108 RepID=UPI0006B516DC|nr:sensor histidine kinase [Niameybacter massiliensis]
MTITLQDFFTYFFLSIAETIILHQLLVSFLNKNTLIFEKYFVGLFGYFIFQMITYFIGCPLFSTAIYYFIFTSIIATIFFMDSTEIKIIASSLFVMLNYSCKIFGVLVATLTHNLTLSILPSQMILNAKAEIIACIFFLICVRIIIYCRHLRLKNNLITYSIIICIFPAAVLFLATRLFLHRLTVFNLTFYFEIGCLLFFTSLALFYLLDKTVVIKESSEKSALMENLMHIQEQYYSKLEDSQKEIASMRHDMKNHLGCIQSMLESDHYDEAKDYITDLYAKSTHLSSPVQSGNVMVDIILNQSLSKMSSHNITCQVNAILPPTLPINNLDLCILLGNLLDNALEACNRMEGSSEERFITLDICTKKEMLYIRVANSFDGIVNVTNNIYHTVKKGQYICGIGLSNIHKVVNKYHGEMDICYTDEIFTVSTLLGLDSNA